MKQQPHTRLSSQPFMIQLPGNNYVIDPDELVTQLDQKLLKKKTWFSPHIRFQSLRGNLLVLHLSFQEQQYVLHIVVEPGRLTVRCSCNQPVQTLCFHSYRALYDIAYVRGDDYFKQFAPGNWAATALANKKAFVFQDDRLGPLIKPRSPHRKVYGLNYHLPVQHNLLQQPALLYNKDYMVCYLILSFSRRTVPPILMPCLASPVKDGNRPKSFLSFTETIAAKNDHYFNENQKILNRYCLAMLKEVEPIQGNNDWKQPTWHWHQYHKLFQLWQQCWPLLGTQSHVLYSHLYLLKYIKGKPRVRKTVPISLSPEKVWPRFELKKYPDHQRLSMCIPHQNKRLHSEAGLLPFFVDCPLTNCFYLLPSLAMAQLVSQMHDAGPFISVFKQQYKSFQKEVITPLTKQGLLEIAKSKNSNEKQGSKSKR
ncbi:MAG: hypothetical protein KGZ74_10610 [Chitinophagaceae bacterium]|nr:hypothetical protein [Chitinophagaceae bacterium]